MSDIEKIQLRNDKLQMSNAVFGTSRLGGTANQYDPKNATRILQQAKDAGINTFDTADIYAQGNSEKLLGKAFSSCRNEVIFATKGGYSISNKKRFLSLLKPLARKLIKKRSKLLSAVKSATAKNAQNFSSSYLNAALEASMKRLKTDWVDIYQLHSPSSQILEQGEVFETLQGMQRSGKIRSYGVSLLAWDDVKYCLGKGIDTLQLNADLLSGDNHQSLLSQAKSDGITVVVRQPFASGLLARNIEDWSIEDFGGDRAKLETGRVKMQVLRELGNPFEIILRYLNHHSSYPAFLFATTSQQHMKTNLDALGLPQLEDDALQELSQHFPVG